MNCTAKTRNPPTPEPELFSLERNSPVGGWPAPLPEVAGWQERLQRHTVEHVDVLPYVQILDAPVPQLVDSTIDFFRRLDLPVAEQVIDVPTISSSSCPSRAVLREPQWWTCLSSTLSSCSSGIPLTFQFRRLGLLVEVNKVLSLDRVRWSSKSLTFQPQVVDFLAVYMVFPQDRAYQRTAAQMVDTPVLEGVRHGFPPYLHPSALPGGFAG